MSTHARLQSDTGDKDCEVLTGSAEHSVRSIREDALLPFQKFRSAEAEMAIGDGSHASTRRRWRYMLSPWRQ